jgi:peptidoglycan/LPS O-acetylase OafA/YrhL
MRRMTELDSIRGLAALGVMIYHLDPPAFLFKGVRVDLFLILSGYLVTTIILSKGNAGNFHLVFQMRRALRIWPLYYMILAVLVLVNSYLIRSTAIDALPNYLTFTQNIQRYWTDSVPQFKWYYTHTWSLALEQQFYLIWPLAIGLLGRKRLVPLSLSLLAISVAARAYGYHWWLLIARSDGFALGSILGILFADPERVETSQRLYRRGLTLSLAGSLAFLVATLPYSLQFDFETAMSLWPSLTILGFNLVYFSLIGLVLTQSGHPSLRILRNRRLCDLGTVSYGLYLYHPLVFLSVSRLGQYLELGEAWWIELVKLVASIIAASLSWRYIERPILVLKNHFRYGPARPIENAPVTSVLSGADA